MNVLPNGLKSRFSLFSLDEWVILILTATVFLPFPAGAAGAGLAAVYVLGKMIVQKKAYVRKGLWLVQIWAILTVVVTALNHNLYGFGVCLYFLLIVVYGLLVRENHSEHLQNAMLPLLAFLSIPACAVAVIQVVFDISIFSDRAASTFVNPNYYAYICELFILLCVFALTEKMKPRWLFWLAIPVNLVGIFLSGCRSAWPAVGAGLLLLFILKGGKRNKRVVFIGIGIAVVAVICLLLFPVLVPRESNFPRSVHLREMIWTEAWHIFAARPLFGGGFLGYQLYSVHAGEAFRVHAHNILLDMLDNFGLVGCALIGVYSVRVIFHRIQDFHRDRMIPLFLAVLLATAIHGITDVPILGSQSGTFIMLLLAL